MRNSRVLNLIIAGIFLAGAIASRAGTLIDVAFTSASVTGKTGFAATGLTTNDFWNTGSLSSLSIPNLQFVDGSLSGAGLGFGSVDLEFGDYNNGASDPMYANYVFPMDGGSPAGVNIDMSVSGLTAGAYDFYLYGHGDGDGQNSIYQLTIGTQNDGSEATTNGPGWLSPVWQEGVQYVEFTNVSLSTGQEVIIIVEPGASGLAVLAGLQIASVGSSSATTYIITQPTNQTVAPGSSATFAVSAGGATPLQYQWQFNNVNISGATNSGYSITNAQVVNSGIYTVIVGNAYGSVTSAVAPLDVMTFVPSVIDVAFTSASATAKTGFAATGVTTNDFWNTYVLNSDGLPNLNFMDGTPSGAGLMVDNAGAAYLNGSSDPMYGTYLIPYEGGNITVTVNNLRGGMYDFYVYGHGNMNNQNGVYDLLAGSQDYGTEETTDAPGWLSLAWAEGLQYVEFTNVDVGPGQTVTLTVEMGTSGFAVISGLQMVPVGPRSPNAYIVTGPTNQVVEQGSNTGFSVLAAGTAPLTYQWQFDNADIAGATNSSYSVTNVQPANGGNYSIIVSNMYGTVTDVAMLTVFKLTGSLIDVAFTSNSVTAKTGFAATGVTAIDYWNTYPGGVSGLDLGGTLPNLKFADGTVSDTGLSVFMPDGPAFSTNGASDPMYGVFLYAYWDAGDLIVQVTNLSPGIYNFYLYGHGPSNNLNSIFRLTAGSLSYGSKATINGPGWLSSVWQEGVQYVEFTNVEVLPSQTITITVQAGDFDYYAVLSGLQIAYLGTPLVTGAVRNGDGSVTLHFAGLPSTAARVWAATNLSSPVLWEPIFTNQNVGASGDWQFTDTNAASYNERFYRFSMP